LTVTEILGKRQNFVPKSVSACLCHSAKSRPSFINTVWWYHIL